MGDHVILVTERDEPLGIMEKLEAHQKGLLHRCFSILVFNTKGELLLQQRALEKYHCGGLWTNTCCGHQQQGQTTLEAASKRLQEEMGFTCPLKEQFTFTYKASFPNGLTEHEYDHVCVGTYDGAVRPNPEEACAYAWKSLAWIRKDAAAHPERYTPWFLLILEKL